VVLLRGVNVGRHQRIAMARLRELLERTGCEDVRTHLQSGNAVVTSEQAPAALADVVRSALAEHEGMDVAVVVRTAGELRQVVAGNPLLPLMDDPARMLVSFLPGPPDADRLAALVAQDFSPDQVHVAGREVYLWCAAGLLVSQATKAFADPRRGLGGTARNWRTVTRLAELAAPPGP
jgi:uncharacterized protein (DUF1697 family)